MSEDLVQKATGLDIWLGQDFAFGPDCETAERMNAMREVVILLAKEVERLRGA